MDTVDHVWIDHNRFTHMGDGLLDIRKDSQYVTVSYNRFDNHNKAFGIGWTTNVKTQITIDHNWFSGTKQRNPSADNCAYAHLYNNYLSAQVRDGDPVWTYGELVARPARRWSSRTATTKTSSTPTRRTPPPSWCSAARS